MKFIYYSLYRFYTKIPIIGNNINIYVTGAMSLLILSPFFAIYNIYNYERYGRLQYDLFTLLIPYCIIYKLLSYKPKFKLLYYYYPNITLGTTFCFKYKSDDSKVEFVQNVSINKIH